MSRRVRAGVGQDRTRTVKNAEQVLFHSTLEPNTEVFSKVSCGVLRSTKFRLNFAKQRRNDMQPSLKLFRTSCTHSNSKCTATLPLACSYRHEAKRGSAETAAGAVRATRTSSRMLKSISSAVSAHPLHKTTATCHKTCVRHAKACSSHQKETCQILKGKTKRSKLFIPVVRASTARGPLQRNPKSMQ